MSMFPDWEKYAVIQRRPLSGCVPTGYEMLLRVAGVMEIKFDTFQDEFDLDIARRPQDEYKNNFVSVANAVHEKYPHVKFRVVSFAQGKGIDKLGLIEERLALHQMVLVSITLKPINGQNGWHIMPIVDMTEDDIVLLVGVLQNGRKQLRTMKKSEFVRIHDEYEGGNDVAYLESSCGL